MQKNIRASSRRSGHNSVCSVSAVYHRQLAFYSIPSQEVRFPFIPKSLPFLALCRRYGGIWARNLEARGCPVTPWRRRQTTPQFDYICNMFSTRVVHFCLQAKTGRERKVCLTPFQKSIFNLGMGLCFKKYFAETKQIEKCCSPKRDCCFRKTFCRQNSLRKAFVRKIFFKNYVSKYIRTKLKKTFPQFSEQKHLA